VDLERIQTVLRPRTPAEAVDLGVLLGRRWWWRLAAAWALTAGPVLAAAHLLLWDHLILAGLAVWWFKPLYEKAPLYYLSRALFDDAPPLRALARHPGRYLGRELIGDLTWARLRPNRAFAAPVALLEGLRGRQRRTRMALLGRGQSTASWLTVVFAHFEGVLYLSLIVLAWGLIPSHLTPELTAYFRDPLPWLMAVDNLVLTLVMAAVAPFYVAAGFALYLNRRVALEGWDIELDFRRLRQRLEGARAPAAAAVLLAAALLALLPSGPVRAEPAPRPEAALRDRQAAAALMEEVLSADAFGKEETITTWQPRFRAEADQADDGGGDWGWLRDLGQFLASAGEGLLWLLAGAAAVAVLLFLQRWLAQVERPQRPRRPATDGPEVLFGLAVTPESLPADVAGRARALCREGRTREALSLLYRASIARLIDRFEVIIPASATEGECLRRARPALGPDGGRLFARLTAAWQQLAYAHRTPEAAAVEALCQEWPTVFAEAA